MMQLEGSLAVDTMCRLAGLSRATFYRHLAQHHPGQEDMELRSQIQQVALDHHRRYGYRRITVELRRRGLTANHKRVARLMREDHLLAAQPRAFVSTTDSNHDQAVYLNLARRMKLTGVNQLWVADLTYIRLRGEFVFLALVLDAFSRKAVGWALERTLTTRLPLLALHQAIAQRQPPPGLVHHSDRGVQYASAQYLQALNQHGILPSMSRPAMPYDNARCESFIRTLKREEIRAHQYQGLDELRSSIDQFLTLYYNRQRLHSALGYRTPEEFELQAQPPAAWPGASLSFPRHPEVYRWKKETHTPHHNRAAEAQNHGEPAAAGSPPHRIDEPPAGYSLTGWSPPEPASASPAEDHSPSNRIK
jgi:transposase InsO family protein